MKERYGKNVKSCKTLIKFNKFWYVNIIKYRIQSVNFPYINKLMYDVFCIGLLRFESEGVKLIY